MDAMHTEHRAMLALSFLKGITQAQLLQALQHYGSATALLESCGREAVGATWTYALCDALQGVATALDKADEELERCAERGVEIHTFGSSTYPTRLAEIADPPLSVFYKGTVSFNAPHVLSVVGTRHITEYGKDLCRHLMQELAALLPDVLIVSGLAYGVDVHAHRHALQQKLPTIGVLAHGLDTLYPAAHRDVALQMCAHGGLLSEYAHGTPATKGNFVRRNRIVAAMSDATIVIESAERGGALITARMAQDYNREVFAFPGRVNDCYSVGVNRLIADHQAQLITSAEEVLNFLQWSPLSRSETPQVVQRELFPQYSSAEIHLLSLLKDGENHSCNQLAMEAGLPFAEVNRCLNGLALKGEVKALPGGRYRKLD